MITILSRFFIKNQKEITDPKVRQSYGMLCGAVGIFLNILLFAGKFFAGVFSNSVAITADAFNNLSDAGSSVITLVGFKMAGQKPDPDHPFGHGRIEYVSGLLVSVVILLMALELFQSSVDKILHPEPVSASLLVLAILAASIGVKLYMCFYNRSVGRKIGSAAMEAASKDSLSDSLATFVVLGTTLFAKFTGVQIDGWCGILVSCFVLLAGKDTIDPLLGQPPEPEFVEQVKEIVLGYRDQGILDIHDLVVHNYGPGRVMISLHAEVPANGDMVKLHDTIDTIEHHLKKELLCEAVIHMDPVATDSENVRKLKGQVRRIIQSMEGEIRFHDFRVVEGPTHTNVIFDVVVPYNYPMGDEQVKSYLNQEIQKISSQYCTVIQVDKDYIRR